MDSIPVVLIFGPTATGKTNLLLSPVFNNSEIINADSMQVYRGMDVGTAKPSADFLAVVKHHLIDIRDPSMQFHAGDFVRLADELCSDIHHSGKLPVICGGTGFYFKNFIFGLPEAPASSEEIRVRLEKRLQTEGSSELFKELAQVDPVSAERIEINDHYRLVRALEVFQNTGKPLSDYKVPDTPRSGYRFFLIGLDRPRDELYRRINERVEQMIDEGLEFEFKKLREAGYGPEDPGMKAIGYSEFFDYESGKTSFEKTVELIKRNSRRYAKRQITFFRQLPDINWYSPEDLEGISDAVREFTGIK